MNTAPAIYLGKVVEKANFRVFIYSPTEEQKLVESWDEFEAHMKTGVWFATAQEAMFAKDNLKKAKLAAATEEAEDSTSDTLKANKGKK